MAGGYGLLLCPPHDIALCKFYIHFFNISVIFQLQIDSRAAPRLRKSLLKWRSALLYFRRGVACPVPSHLGLCCVNFCVFFLSLSQQERGGDYLNTYKRDLCTRALAHKQTKCQVSFVGLGCN